MPPTPAVLAAQLEALGSRLIYRVFDTVHGHEPIEAPDLYELVESLDKALWQNDRVEALYAAIGTAADGLPDEPVRPGASLTWRQAARGLFNIDRLDLEHVSGAKYRYLFNYTLNNEAVGHRVDKKPIADAVRVLLAKKLLAMSVAHDKPLAEDMSEGRYPSAGKLEFSTENEQGTAGRPGARPTPSLAAQLKTYADEPFVERPDYTQLFQDLLAQGHRRIVFNGGRGNGKSRLALELVARQPKAIEDGIFINASSASTLDTELRNIAVSLGERKKDPVEVFTDLVSAPDAPSYVILDNLEDTGLLETILLPSDNRSTIVITANRKLPKYEASSLEVTPMQEPESIDLVEKLRPTLNGQERQRLAQALGYRPLAVVHACGYIIGGDFSLDDFLSALKSNAANVFREVPDLAKEPALTAIYALILMQLEQLLHTEHPVKAREVLELIACVAPEDIPPDLIRDGMGLSDDSQGPIEFRKAVLVLQTRFLVRAVGERLAIHPLTQEILRALLREGGKEQALCLRLHQPIHRMLQGETRNKLVSLPVIDRIVHICKVVVGLRAIGTEVFREINFGRTLAVIARSRRQIRLKQDSLNSSLDDGEEVAMKAVSSVLDDDEPEWVAFEDVHELIRDYIPTMYSLGSVTSEIYLEQTAAVISITSLEDVQQYETLEASDLIDLCTALLAHGLCTAAISILQSQEDRVRKFFKDTVLSGNDKALGTEFLEETVEYGDYKALQGEAWIVKAEWSQAGEALSVARLLYDYGGHDMLAMRGNARALKLQGDLAWMSGNVNMMPHVEIGVQGVIFLRKEDWQKDILTTSYLDHVLARQYMAEYLQGYYRWFQYKDDPGFTERSAEVSHANAKQAETAVRLLKQANQEYLIGDYVRENYDLTYERILLVGLLYPDDIDEIVQAYAPKGVIAEDSLLQLRIELARFKVTTLHGDKQKDALLITFDRIAEQIIALGRGCEARYWLAEGAAAMCVVSAQINSRRPDPVGELRDAYTAIGRQDRLVAVEKAIEAWCAGDRTQFKREFAYLLTY